VGAVSEPLRQLILQKFCIGITREFEPMKSMTAFGRGEAEDSGCKMSIELRTLNHRFLDLHLRMPRSLMGLEDRLRHLISAHIARGRVEISISMEYTGQSPRSLVADKALLNDAAAILTSIQEEWAIPEPWGWDQLLHFPEVVAVQESSPTDDEALWAVLGPAVQQALEVVDGMRHREGEFLRVELLALLQRVSEQVEVVAQRAQGVPQAYREKLASRLAQLLPEANPVDPQRLAQEVALLADRADITEELARLRSHLEQFHTALDAKTPIGRKLDFVIQEMNREVNTIGSKSAEAGTSQAVIEIKSDLERIREQVQNLE
jgi:uncharacterized protein (TIGR00255 family)